MLLATASVAADGEADVMTAINELTVESLISDLALILVLGAISTLIFKRLRQPIVLGYIVAGFLASPHMWLLPSVTSEANIEFWAQIGIVVLLFTLGLEFSFKKLMNVGGSAVVTALVIVMGMMTLGFVTPLDAALVVVAIGAGAMTVSHANDSYFWVVTNFGEMEPQDGYKTQTLGTLVIGIAAIINVLLISAIF